VRALLDDQRPGQSHGEAAADELQVGDQVVTGAPGIDGRDAIH
jgi:hypothetical protein